MGKNKDGRRAKGKDKAKNTFKKYGKNTARGLRIKQDALEKRAIKAKQQIAKKKITISLKNTR